MSHSGCVVWFTGLPCSGKSTVARLVCAALKRQDRRVELLDGDEIRKHFSKGVGFSKEDRQRHLERVAYLAHLLSKHGVIVLASFVSPYRENREYARNLTQAPFFEVFVDTPLEECIKRDVKGMYKKAIAGEIKQFTGISDPYEASEKPELTIRTLQESAQESAERTLALVEPAVSGAVK